MAKQVEFFDAYIKIDVRCKLADDTKIPSGYCMSIGEPDKNGLVEYALSGYISRDQLQQIYAILKRPEPDASPSKEPPTNNQ